MWSMSIQHKSQTKGAPNGQIWVNQSIKIIVTDYYSLNEIKIEESESVVIQKKNKYINKLGRNLFFSLEYQLMNVEGIMKSGNHFITVI